MYLVDANVLSETTKPRPAERVVHWLREHEADIAIDPVILGEIHFGILLQSSGARRRKLEAWFTAVVESINCLPWDAQTGLRWAQLLAALRRSGRSMPTKESLIAATALVHQRVVVTRNARDFAASGVTTLDPFAIA